MKYCPDCDMEFIDSVTVCTDCGRKLFDKDEYFASKAKREAAEMEKMRAEREKRREMEKANRAMVEEASSGSGKPQRTPAPTAGVYVKRADRYEDLRSSASAFLIVGILMAVFTVISFGKELHLPIALPANFIMKIMFAVFTVGSFVIWFRTNESAKTMKGQIGEEEQATKQLTEWFLNNYTAPQIDKAVRRAYGNLRPELFAMKRMEFIQDTLITTYDLSDQAYVESLAEDIYPKIYVEEDEEEGGLAPEAPAEEKKNNFIIEDVLPDDEKQSESEDEWVDLH